MSATPISRSADLKRLRDEGYEISIRAGHLVVDHVPYVTTAGEVALGKLISTLSLTGDETAPPETHVVMFSGGYPCHKDGRPLLEIVAGSGRQDIGDGLAVDHTLSSKPPSGSYPDYYSKITTYVTIIAGPAQAIDPSLTAQTFAVVEASENESVFRYTDTATSRAGIGVANSRLERGNVAIAGLGGTGSYVFDLVAKTPVREIHLFDADTFYSHNAFRAPGAASLPELRAGPTKVGRLAAIYGEMRRGIVCHEYALTAANAHELDEMEFVFLCFDGGPEKRAIIEHLQARGIPFVDVGIGVHEVDGALGGVLRLTTSTPEQSAHVWEKGRIPFSHHDVPNEYARNIQVADLNALNAALAVIRWKKLWGFYLDLEREHFSAYTIDGNHLLNEDKAE